METVIEKDELESDKEEKTHQGKQLTIHFGHTTKTDENKENKDGKKKRTVCE